MLEVSGDTLAFLLINYFHRAKNPATLTVYNWKTGRPRGVSIHPLELPMNETNFCRNRDVRFQTLVYSTHSSYLTLTPLPSLILSVTSLRSVALVLNHPLRPRKVRKTTMKTMMKTKMMNRFSR